MTPVEVLSSPPIVTPLVVTFLCYFITTVLAAIEKLSSTPPRNSSARNTPSPHIYNPGSSTRTRGTTNVPAGAHSNANAQQDSPESLEEGWNMTRSPSGKALRMPPRNKVASVSPNYGSLQRNQNNSNVRATTGAAGVEVGGGSIGDNTRKSFYNLLFLALFSRMILLPVEGTYLGMESDPNSSGCMFARTLPNLVFVSAFSLLVLFYAQLAGTASSGGPRGLSLILLRPGYFRNGNIFVYVIYAVLLLLTIIYPGKLSQDIFKSVLWVILSILYFTLLTLLAYFGPVLVGLLRPSLEKRSGLAIRLIAMCILCFFIFLSRAITFAFAVGHKEIEFSHSVFGIHLIDVESDNKPHLFVQDCLGYTMIELVPSLLILMMMHQKRPQPSTQTVTDDTARDGGRYMAISQPYPATNGAINTGRM